MVGVSRILTPQLRWRIGGLLWALCFQFFIAEQVTSAAWTIPYSWSQNMISDLGVVTCGYRTLTTGQSICSPQHAVLNSSLFVQALLVGGGALLLRDRFMHERTALLAHRLILLACLTLMVIATVPQDASLMVHVSAAAIHLVSGNLALILTGHCLQKQGFSFTSRASQVLGTIGLTGNLLMWVGFYRPIGLGTMQRIGSYPLPLMLTWLGIFFLLQKHSRKASPIP